MNLVCLESTDFRAALNFSEEDRKIKKKSIVGHKYYTENIHSRYKKRIYVVYLGNEEYSSIADSGSSCRSW